MPAVYCTPPRSVCLPSGEFSKVSITPLNCFIFHTGFTPCLPYYDFPPLFKSENIFTHILRQLDRSLGMALFKFEAHHNQNDPMINNPDLLFFCCRGANKPARRKNSGESCPSTLQYKENTIRGSGVWCLCWSISRRQKTESTEARIKCSG